MLEKIDHIGIAVRSIDQAKPFFEKVLGLSCEGEEVVESQKVKTGMFELSSTLIVFTIHNLCLVRMKHQTTVLKAISY